MQQDTLLHAANVSTLFFCMVLKFPQIFVLMRAKTSSGVSLNSLLLELTGGHHSCLCSKKTRPSVPGSSSTALNISSVLGHELLVYCCLLWFIVFVTYQMYYDYPPPTYLEYPILIAQDVFLLFLILHYNGSLKHSLIYVLVFVAGWRLLTVDKWIIDLAMSLCTFISAASKFVQLQCLWSSKDAGQISALTWAMATYTCMARIYTTTVSTGDMQVLVRFIAMAVLNLWVTLTVLYYQRRSRSSKKEE